MTVGGRVLTETCFRPSLHKQAKHFNEIVAMYPLVISRMENHNH